jgi:hypothetical protein
MLLALIPLLTQDPGVDPAPPAPPAPIAVAEDPAARALLQAVAQRQHAGGGGREVFAFDVQLNLRERGEQVNEFDLGLNYTRKSGELLKLSLFDRVRGTRVEKGFDGRTYWLREDEGPQRDLSAHEFAEDRQAIDEAIELAADLLLVLDLATLGRRAADLRLTTEANGERVLNGRVPRGERTWEFALRLAPSAAPDALQPRGLDLRERNPDVESAREIPYLQHRRFTLENYKAFQGRSVPQVITELDPAIEDPVEGTLRILELRALQWEDRALAPVEGALEVPKR